MKKILVFVILMLGLTFIYNPRNNSGFVYINNDTYNWIILVDVDSNVLRYYRAAPAGEERLDYGYDKWLRDKVEKGMPFKSVISPYPNQQLQEKRRYYEK